MNEYNTKLMEELDVAAAKIRETVPCRCCGQYSLNAYVQMGVGRKPAYILVECRNRDCALHMATREFENWLTMDLGQWGGSEQPGWQRMMQDAARQDNLNRLVETYILQYERPLEQIALRDYREAMARTLPHARREVATAWLHMYTRRGA